MIYKCVLSSLIATMLSTTAYAESSLEKDSAEVICLAKNMYFEARNQSTIGQIAVANVTLNRVSSKRFPNTVCEVVYQAKLDWRGNPRRNACHYSWYCDGKSDTVYDRETYLDILKLATVVYQSPKNFIDVSQGSTHYHANYATPWWSKNFVQTVIIDDHVFYREE